MKPKPKIPHPDCLPHRRFVYELIEELLAVLAEDKNRAIDQFRNSIDKKIKQGKIK